MRISLLFRKAPFRCVSLMFVGFFIKYNVYFHEKDVKINQLKKSLSKSLHTDIQRSKSVGIEINNIDPEKELLISLWFSNVQTLDILLNSY